MTITQLKYIISLSKHKNFSVAAENCSISQPTMSMQIKKLENELKVSIFERSHKKINLTEIGKKIICQAKIIVSEYEKIDKIINKKQETLDGEFLISNFTN